MSVSINSTWKEIEWWSDATADPNVRAYWRAIARCEENISGNYSNVYFYVQKSITNTAGGWANYPASKSMKITGTGASSDSHSATATWKFGYCDSSSWADADGSYSDFYWANVAHKNDGSLTIKAHITGDRVVSGSIDTYIDLVLPTIPRASNPTVSTSSLTVGGSLTINTNRKSSSFTHTITVSCGGHSVTYNNVGASQSFTATTSEWMPYMTNKSMTATVSCTTYNGTKQIGSAQSCSFTLNVDTSVYHPAIISIEHSDINADTVALETEGTYIKGFSNLSLSTTVTVNSADYGSVVQSVKITHNGVTRTFTNDLGVIEFTVAYAIIVSANTIVIKVTDNRGVEVSQTLNLTVIQYDVPKLSAIEIKRVNASEQESETGIYLKYRLSSTVFWGSFGQVNNELKVYSRSKLPSAQNYSEWTLENTINTAGTDQYTSYEITGTCNGEYSSSTQFDVQIKVEDKLGNAVLYAKVLEGIPVFAWGADHFDVYGSFHIHDREDPSQYVTFSSSDSLVMHNYSWSGSWSNNSSASRTIQITGKGLVIINCYVRNDGTDDTGQCDATIYLWNTSNANQGLLASSGNRVSASSTHQISANASTQYYYDGSSANSRLRCNISCTKNGTNSWRIQATTIGCTLAVL